VGPELKREENGLNREEVSFLIRLWGLEERPEASGAEPRPKMVLL